MPTNSQISNIRIPTLSDAAVITNAVGNAITDLDRLLIPKYANATARNAANTSPQSGDLCYIIDQAAFNIRIGAGWYPWMTGWATWNPTWTTSTGANIPSLGNGVQVARYYQQGRTVHVKMNITAGSTTDYNSGTTNDNWGWDLPVNPSAAFQNSGVTLIGNGYIATGASGKGRCPVSLFLPGGNINLAQLIVTGADTSFTAFTNSGTVDAVTPYTWTTSGIIHFEGSYEAA